MTHRFPYAPDNERPEISREDFQTNLERMRRAEKKRADVRKSKKASSFDDWLKKTAKILKESKT